MRDVYLVKMDNLKKYQSYLKIEEKNCIQQSHKIFLNGYFYNCSNSVIISMRDKLEKLFLKLEENYKNVDKWLNDYISDIDNLEKTLASGYNNINDIETRNYVQSFIDSKNVSVKEVTRLLNNNKTNIKNEQISSKKTWYENAFEKVSNTINEINKEVYGTHLTEYEQLTDDIKLLNTYRDNINNEIDSIMKNFTLDDSVSLLSFAKSIEQYEEDPNSIDMENLTKEQKTYIYTVQQKAKLATIDILIMNYEKQRKLLAYISMSESDEYKKFASNYDCIKLCDNYDENEKNPSFDLNKIDYLSVYERNILVANDGEIVADVQQNLEAGDETINVKDFYEYSTDDQKMMYHYLFQTKGKEAAGNYLMLILDDMRREIGKANAQKWIREMESYYQSGQSEYLWEKVLGFIAVLGESIKEGFKDGIVNYFDGVDSIFKAEKSFTIEDYENQYKMEYLSENKLNHIYNFSSGIGNMVPSMAIGFATFGVGGATSMGLSMFGNARDNAYKSGADWVTANLYGMFVGTEEAATQYFLGGIPGLGAAGIETNLIKSMLKEGLQEFTQTYYEAALDKFMLGEEVDLGEVTEEAFISFAYGAVTSATLFGITNLPTIVKCKIDGIEITTNMSEMKHKLEQKNIHIENLENGSIKQDILRANYTTDSGSLAVLKINDVNQIQIEDLKNIKNGNLVLFQLNDGQILDYVQMLTLKESFSSDGAITNMLDKLNNISKNNSGSIKMDLLLGSLVDKISSKKSQDTQTQAPNGNKTEISGESLFYRPSDLSTQNSETQIGGKGPSTNINTTIKSNEITFDSISKDNTAQKNRSRDLETMQKYIAKMNSSKPYTRGTYLNFAGFTGNNFDVSNVKNLFNDNGNGMMVYGNSDIKQDYRITIKNSNIITEQHAFAYTKTLIEEIKKRKIEVRMKNFWEDDALILYIPKENLASIVSLLEDLKDSSKYGELVSSATKEFGSVMPLSATVGDTPYYGITASHVLDNSQNGLSMSIGGIRTNGGISTFNEYTSKIMYDSYMELLKKYGGDKSKITPDELYDRVFQMHKKRQNVNENENIPLWMNRENYLDSK